MRMQQLAAVVLVFVVAASGRVLADHLTPDNTVIARSNNAAAAVDRFVQSTYLVSPRTSQQGAFGASLAIEGNRLVVGSPQEEYLGAAYVFEHDGARWSLEATLRPADRGFRFGSAVAVSGDTIAVAEHLPLPQGFEQRRGRVFVFARSGTEWTEQSQLSVPPDLDAHSFGRAVAIDDETLLVGGALPAEGESMGEGRVIVFTREVSAWRRTAIISPPDGATTGRASFGTALSLDGDRALIGMPDADAAFVFARHSGSWEIEASWRGEAASAFGRSVDLDDATAIVGAPLTLVPGTSGPMQAGSAHVFARTINGWTEQARLGRGQPAADDRFGELVALSGNVAAVGVLEVACCTIDRLVLLYVREGTTWSEREVVHPDPVRQIPPVFGSSIALWRETLAVGSGSQLSSTADEVLVTERSLLDEDHDGLPDGWEARFGLAIEENIVASGAAGDPDGDGRTNAEELAAGTHPLGEPSATRYLAEGATGMFDTRIALANPGPQSAIVLLRFLGAGDWTRAVVVQVPPLALRRVLVNEIPDLGANAFSTVVESSAEVVVEREMTWDRTWGYGSHGDAAVPSPATTWYFAEGATHETFDLFYLLQNPGDTSADVNITYLRPFPGLPIQRSCVVPPRSRYTIWVDTEPDLEAAELSAVIESTNGVPIIAERAMYMSTPGRLFTAGHAAAGATAPAIEWSLAEGATGPYFDLFLLIANPNSTAADVEARYLRPDGRVITRAYRIAPRSRFNVWVDHESDELADTAVASVVSSTNNVPVVVERAMWWPGPTAATWTEAHAVLGSTAAVRWAFAAGQLEVANAPDAVLIVEVARDTWPSPANVLMTLAFPDGSFTQAPVQMGGTTTLDPTVEVPQATGRLFDVHLRSGERVRWGPHYGIYLPPVAIEVEGGVRLDAHGYEWLATRPAIDTYYLIANPGPTAGSVRVTLVYEDGPGPARTYEIAANRRLNIDTRAEFPMAVGRSFGAVVESVGDDPVPIVVERATYRRAQGQAWAAGSAAMGTKLR